MAFSLTAAFAGTPVRQQTRSRAAPCRAALWVEDAATRANKEASLQRLGLKLKPEAQTMFVAGLNYKGFTVKDFETFRKKLPQGTELIVAKNTVMVKAIEGTQYAALSEACVGPNAFLFTGEDVASSIKVFNEMAKALKKARGMELQWNGGVLDGKYVPAKDIGKLENLPTKKQVIGQVARAIKQVTTKVARGTNGVAAKLAYGTKALADGKSDLIKA